MDPVRQLLSVLFVLGLLIGLLWWMRKKTFPRINLRGSARRSARRIEAIERVVLSPQHALHLVRLGDRGVVVAAHGSGCTVVESRPWQEWETQSATSAFGASR
jgi:flagellar biogenesis protein FliO